MFPASRAFPSGPRPEGSENGPDRPGTFPDTKTLRHDRSVKKNYNRFGRLSELASFAFPRPASGDAKCCCGPHAVKNSNEMLLWPTRRAQFLTPRRGKSKFRILDAFSSAPRRISGRVLVSTSRGNLSTGSVRARSTRARWQHTTRMGTVGGGKRKRLKSSQLMGGESRGSVVADEGVRESRSTRCMN